VDHPRYQVAACHNAAVQKLWTIGIFVVLASLDNAAIMMIPSMILPISADLGVSEAALGGLTAAVILVTAVTAGLWGYLGDRTGRKNLLFWGTIIWVVGVFGAASSGTYGALFAAMVGAAIGFGSITSVGFSVVSDFVPPHRRGVALSFWGLSQGAGGLLGGLAASQLGANDWRRPLWIIAATGFGFAVLFLTSQDPARGQADPELVGRAHELEEKIQLDQLPELIRRRSNVWLISKGLVAQLAYGSLLWVPLLYQTKIVELGYSIETATRAGGLYFSFLQLAAISSIAAGWLGDRWQARRLSGRARLSMIGILGAVPFFIAFFAAPLSNLPITDGGSSSQVTGEVLASFVTNRSVMLAFVLAFAAVVLTSIDSPNAFALIVDVNLPEHRGTVFGLVTLAEGVTRSAGNGLVGWLTATVITSTASSRSYAIALAGFQLFFLPTGYCYWRLTRTSPADIEDVRRALRERAATLIDP